MAARRSSTVPRSISEEGDNSSKASSPGTQQRAARAEEQFLRTGSGVPGLGRARGREEACAPPPLWQLVLEQFDDLLVKILLKIHSLEKELVWMIDGLVLLLIKQMHQEA